MTSPRIPDHMSESDEIVDLTPAFSPESDPGEIMDLTPAFAPDAATKESGDMASTVQGDVLQSQPEDISTIAQPAVPERTSNEHRVTSSPPPVPPFVPEPTHEAPQEAPREKRPQAMGKRWKSLLLVIVGVAALAFAGNRVLGKSLGNGSASSTTTSTGTQSIPRPAASTPAPKSVQIGNKPVTTTAGPFILLNPGVVRQGTSISVTGSGFDVGAVVDLSIKRQGSSKTLASTFVQADKGGAFGGASLTMPMSLSSGSFTVVAQERHSSHAAQAIGTVAGGAPQVKLGLQVGKPGDAVVLALHGFAPGETIKVYWNSLSGQPLTTFQADSGGSVGQDKLQVPNGAVGNNTFLFVGAQSQSLVAANFLVLQLYPTVKLSSYALQADNRMSFSGTGFGPSERVFVFLNNTTGQPLAIVPTDNSGAFKNASGFTLPFVLKGKQTLIFMGEQSRAANAVSFNVLPYAPDVQPSTYGGFPGTAITFYVSGFARNEVVHVYAGHTKSSMGTLVSCFQANDKGKAAAVGSYLIPGNAQGTMGFALVGAKSGGVGEASVTVSAPPAPVQTSPQAPFTCPLDPPTQPSQPPASSTPGAP